MSRMQWLRWTAGFVAFPVAGLAGRAVAGPVDDVRAALLGGLVTGAVVGAGQALAAGRRLPGAAWVVATAAGSALGLTVGTWAVDYDTSLGALAVAGAVSGVTIAAAQAVSWTAASRGWRLVWTAAGPVLWALGWVTTTLAGVDVERQYTVFGATGALVLTVLSGLLLSRVVRRPA